ncbi:hypothetical protein POM88_034904 [Heracleum sosnowskyi]|uniref:Uncharacterized protein n=1 Tax=Heracleum sosnowskyi TaxID=360622 RepID=A0AAD8HK60_9APIA|nr:hypothetical protein POM88_034904 [Heracleum sosnowskyi]
MFEKWFKWELKHDCYDLALKKIGAYGILQVFDLGIMACMSIEVLSTMTHGSSIRSLPRKLKQSSTKEEIKQNVYLRMEPAYASHDHSRSLGDLTGIKENDYHKHNEKTCKYDKCSKICPCNRI